MHREDFTLCGHKLSLFQAKKADCPLIVFHSFSDEGEAVYQELRKQNAPECHFLSIAIHDWQREMSPWPAAALSKDAEVFSGGADAYLESLLSTILPWAGERIRGKASFMGVAGYSLAGLFALYAMYKTDVFSRVAAMSGSFWFPGMRNFCKENTMKILPEKLYLSIGDQESRTRHPILKTMQENTEELLEYFRSLGIPCQYELNPGNHFQDVNLRCAKGISELLQ